MAERYLIAKEAQLPPRMNAFLIVNALSVLKFAPLVFLFNGYWMIDNRQIFDNEHPLINNHMEKMKSHHLVISWDLLNVSRHTPVLIVMVFAISILIAKIFF